MALAAFSLTMDPLGQVQMGFAVVAHWIDRGVGVDPVKRARALIPSLCVIITPCERFR